MRKKTKIDPELIKDIVDTMPLGIMGLGISKKINSWDSIENFAKNHGIYNPIDLRLLIANQSPIKKMGFQNLELVRIVDEEIKKSKNPSFHAAAVKHFEVLCVLAGIDPYTVHMGANWEKVQKIKNKKFTRKSYPKKYAKVIDNLKAKYNRVLENNPNAYSQWCLQNKKNRQVLKDVAAMLQLLKKRNNQK